MSCKVPGDVGEVGEAPLALRGERLERNRVNAPKTSPITEDTGADGALVSEMVSVGVGVGEGEEADGCCAC